MKKLPNSKSIEELLNDLNTPNEATEDKIQIEEDSILTFLSFYNIEPGKERIKDMVLYKLYKQFTKNPKTSKAFKMGIGNYIESVVEFNDQRFYLINHKVLNLSKRAMEFLKKDIKANPRHRVTSWRIHFDNFVKKYELIPENDFIWASFKVMYNLYDKWTYEIKKNNRLSEKEFEKLCQIYLDYKQNKTSYWYKVNVSITKYLSKEMDKKLKARNSFPNETEEKNRRNNTKNPALKPEFNLKTRSDLIDYDYLDQLSEKEKAWLNKFTEEYTNDKIDRKHLKRNLHNTGDLKKDCDDRNNARNRDILTRVKAAGRLKATESINEADIAVMSPEDQLIFKETVKEHLDLVKQCKNRKNNKS